MSVGILTPFDDLVRRRDGKGGGGGGGVSRRDVFSPLSMAPFQSSTHNPSPCCPHDREEREREEREVSVFNLEGSQMREILYAIWVTVCLTG